MNLALENSAPLLNEVPSKVTFDTKVTFCKRQRTPKTPPESQLVLDGCVLSCLARGGGTVQICGRLMKARQTRQTLRGYLEDSVLLEIRAAECDL